MDKHISDGEVQTNACQILNNIAMHDEHLANVTECGAVERVMNAMNKHLTNVDLQTAACKALKTLTKIQ